MLITSPWWNLKNMMRHALHLRSSFGPVGTTSAGHAFRRHLRSVGGGWPPSALPFVAQPQFCWCSCGIWVPDTAGVFRTGRTSAVYALSLVWMDQIFKVQCPSQEAKGFVGFVDYVHDVGSTCLQKWWLRYLISLMFLRVWPWSWYWLRMGVFFPVTHSVLHLSVWNDISSSVYLQYYQYDQWWGVGGVSKSLSRRNEGECT